MRRHYEAREHVLATRAEGNSAADYRVAAHAYRQLRRDLLAVERRTLIELRGRHAINDETLRRIQRDLDLEEVRLNALP
jgi:CPA1 family monovalent cation:H+ antiporter